MRARTLFTRLGVRRDVLSLRRALTRHAPALTARPLSLREAARRLPVADPGKGFERGCRHPDEIQLQFFGKHNLAQIIPAWVGAREDATRTVEGILLQSNLAHTDFPFKPWHIGYDWNFHLQVDPQYAYLVSEEHHMKTPPVIFEDGRVVVNSAGKRVPTFECEWDTAFLPDYAWPQDGSRVWLRGRWIYDCGHVGGESGRHRSEIHPPKAVVSFRSEAVQFRENRHPTRATQAVVYIGRRGGYFNHAINDEDYEFDIPLPPRPTTRAQVVTTFQSQTGQLPVAPVLTPAPRQDARVVRVRIPLAGVTPHPDEYGVIISVGWTDVDGSVAAETRTHSVTIASLEKHTKLDTTANDEWYVFAGINGRWRRARLDGSNPNINFTIGLHLHKDDPIHITVCGFEADRINETMGADSGVAAHAVGGPIPDAEAVDVARAIRDTGLATGSKVNENEALDLMSMFHPAGTVATFRQRSSPRGMYTLTYTIE